MIIIIMIIITIIRRRIRRIIIIITVTRKRRGAHWSDGHGGGGELRDRPVEGVHVPVVVFALLGCIVLLLLFVWFMICWLLFIVFA